MTGQRRPGARPSADWTAGRGYALAVALLLAAVLGLAAFAAAVIAPDMLRQPQASQSPAPTREALAPMRIAIPADANCTGCHIVRDSAMNVPAPPFMAHPIEGWTSCTECHATGRLVEVAPGHTGIKQEECLLCHQPAHYAPGASALPRPHHVVTGASCKSCHGAGEAPLPTDMAGRSNCWICHPGADSQYLFEQPGDSPSPTERPAPSVSAAP
jgi:hypothetical protein